MEINQEELTSILNILDAEINQYKESDTSVHPYDIAEQLLKLRDISSEEYEKIIKKIPHELFAEVLSCLVSPRYGILIS